MSRIYVTGIGIISALGRGLKANAESLSQGRSGLRYADFLDSKYNHHFVFGEVRGSNDALRKMADIDESFSRTTLLAHLAFEEAVRDANLGISEIQSFNTAFISASTVGGMDATGDLYRDAAGVEQPSKMVATYEPSRHTLQLAKRYGIRGLTNTINTACSSSANAIAFGASLIKSGRADRVIVGGADSLAKFTVNGFNALMILSDEECRPFDQDRKGLNLGEGAAYLILEREEVCNGKKVYAEYMGAGNASDAFHASATSPEAMGPALAMKRALSDAGIEHEQIDFINAHGTGTVNNDETEVHALQTIYEEIPPFMSTKSYTGHTLGAAGGIEAVFSILSLSRGEIFPSLNCNKPITENLKNPDTLGRKDIGLTTVLTNSFGFGGNCTSLIFKKLD